jgi:hypothetical protein
VSFSNAYSFFRKCYAPGSSLAEKLGEGQLL